MKNNLRYFAISDEEMSKVTGGENGWYFDGSWHWGDDWGDAGYWGLQSFEGEVQEMLLENRNANAGYRKEFENHYIILTEVIRSYEADAYGRMTVLAGMSIRYTVYGLDDTFVTDGYIADFIM